MNHLGNADAYTPYYCPSCKHEGLQEIDVHLYKCEYCGAYINEKGVILKDEEVISKMEEIIWELRR